MAWTTILETLSPLVAVVLLYAWSQAKSQQANIATIRAVSESIVKPLQEEIREGHEASAEDRRLTRDGYRAMTDQMAALCLKINGHCAANARPGPKA